MLSTACQIGIRAMLFLSLRPDSDYVSAREISDQLGLSRHFLAKILHQLTSKGLLLSLRGPNGGLTLARDASDITLIDIVRAIDGHDLFTECVLGLPGCGVEKPCALHDQWASARDRLHAMMEESSIEHVAIRTRNKGYRLGTNEILSALRDPDAPTGADTTD